MITIRDLMTDPDLFGEQFSGNSWQAWRALLAGFYSLELDEQETDAFKRLTGRQALPDTPHDELWLAVGRRGGKSNISALLAIYEAVFNDHADKLAPGEVATVMVLAADRKQARSAFRYISGLLHSNPMFEQMIVREDKESIELNNRAAIEVGTASFRAVRGYSIPCVIADEIAFWRSEDSANPDFEIINALRPAMASLNGKLIALSSPYAKRGALYDAYKRYFGKDDKEILVAQASAATMNPSLDLGFIRKAYQRDPESAKAEYGAQFRSDLEAYVSREAVENLVVTGRYELPPLSEYKYFGFVDPSGGSSDAMTLAIGHAEENGMMVLDATREVKPPFSPESVVSDFSALLKTYRISEVYGDRYAGEWPRERFREHGINYEIAPKPRSDLYRDLLPKMNSGLIELLDNERLTTQICSLERRTSRGGRDSIDHAPGAHDDLANAVAGVIALLEKPMIYDYSKIL